ncbi:GGDEF domain-containing protein [Reinekea sp. G2M2-21]|uniref:GGDEF domain-containing protein n=1 Tax=Reinekea sp. G2M2-21 TaxID=2788942 RepID=UPI0018A9EE7F|nr:GGDEF domain-containing protein [Reinekea sp. G2M2-21]
MLLLKTDKMIINRLTSIDSNNAKPASETTGVMLKTIRTLKHKVTALENKLSKAQHLAHHDELTGLANRSLLRDRLNQAIKHAIRHQNLVAVLLLDLNDFKRINDTFGHHIGDALLINVASRLNSCIRDADSVYRYGGDEFVVLVPDVENVSGPFELKSKLLACIAKPYNISEQAFSISASIGVAIYPKHGADQHALIKYADSKMYTAKQVSQEKSLPLLR